MTLNRTNSYAAIVASLFYCIFYVAAGSMNDDSSGGVLSVRIVEGFVLALLMPLAVHLYQRVFHAYLISPLAATGIHSSFYHYEPYSYLILLTSLGFFLGLQPGIPLTLALCAMLVLIQAGLFMFSLDEKARASVVNSEKYIALLFLVSGFSALIYQVVWQRTLFTTFGINSESVTVIVSVFMFGLGIGSLAGGYLQNRFALHLLQLFLILEVSIGLFGLISLSLIHRIGALAGMTDTGALVFWTYAVLAIPTLLMGATLPILVAYLQGYFHNIGKTLGLLYAFNTVGSAIAAFFTVQVLFVFFGQQSVVILAAACNFITALLIFDASRKLNRLPSNDRPFDSISAPNANGPLPYAFVFVVLLAIGYISLSQEILWYRLLGYMTANKPQVFGLLLTAFLAGIAWGSLRSKKVCELAEEPCHYLFRALLWTAIIFYVSTPAIAHITALLGKQAGAVAAYLAVASVAFFSGGILPTLVHLGVDNRKAGSGQTVAWLYFANIIGATLGPLLTGFVLLEKYSLEENVLVLTGVTIALLLAILVAIPKPLRYKLHGLGGIALLLIVGMGTHSILYRNHLEKLQYASTDLIPFKHKLENRGGIITVQGGSPTDIMFGHGIYDGQFNTDPLVNSNLIDRAYMIAALHRKPTRVLEIGLSTGSWSKVISDYAPVQELTIIEINKGYAAVVEKYPDIATVLHHPKATLHIDDGRRWLKNHPREKFDLIVMNTTYYWRSNATNLLSKEFLELCKRHLNPGGVIYYNTTGSKDVVFTAAHIFKHVTTYSTFVAASDSPFDLEEDEVRNNLLKFETSDGGSLFKKDGRYRELLQRLSRTRLKDVRNDMLSKEGLWLITDDNMAVEYKAP